MIWRWLWLMAAVDQAQEWFEIYLLFGSEFPAAPVT